MLKSGCVDIIVCTAIHVVVFDIVNSDLGEVEHARLNGFLFQFEGFVGASVNFQEGFLF